MTPTPSTSFRGIADIRLVGRQVYYEQLTFWLNPIAAVFTVGFSVVFLILLGATFATAQQPPAQYKPLYPSQKASVTQTIGVTDVTISYPLDLSAQMLEYSAATRHLRG